VQNRHDRLIAAGALVRQDAIKTFAGRPEMPEGIGTDGDTPIDSGDDPADVLALWAIPKGHLGQIRQSLVLEFGEVLPGRSLHKHWISKSGTRRRIH
jgi:hypothetical protein